MSKKKKIIISGILGAIIGVISITYIFNATQKQERIEELITLMEAKYEGNSISYDKESDVLTVGDFVVKWDGSTIEQEILHSEVKELMKENGIKGTECWVVINDIWKTPSDKDYDKVVVVTDDGVKVEDVVSVLKE